MSYTMEIVIKNSEGEEITVNVDQTCSICQKAIQNFVEVELKREKRSMDTFINRKGMILTVDTDYKTIHIEEMKENVQEYAELKESLQSNYEDEKDVKMRIVKEYMEANIEATKIKTIQNCIEKFGILFLNIKNYSNIYDSIVY